MKACWLRRDFGILAIATAIVSGSTLALCTATIAQVQPVQNKALICYTTATAQCADCADTANGYWCKSDALPFGTIYGTCIQYNSTTPACFVPDQPNAGGCGRSDWSCDPNPQPIIGSPGNCLADTPLTCAS